MDPLSITAGVASLLGVSFKVCLGIKQLREASSSADAKLKGLLSEVECFMQLLQHMSETMKEISVQAEFLETGHIGSHWRSIAVCISDGNSLLGTLQNTIQSVGKSSRVLDGMRKHFRLQSVSDDIHIYQEQIRSYRDTIQLSLQTVILWNQLSLQRSTEAIPSGIDGLNESIRDLARRMNQRISILENNITSDSALDDELRQLSNRRRCVRAAAAVVSSASTILGLSDGQSTVAPSDFNDVFPSEPSESMLRWFTEVDPSVYEEQDITPDFGRIGTVHAVGTPAMADHVDHADIAIYPANEGDSDSDDEMEAEIVQFQLRKGKRELESGNLGKAERALRKGYCRLPRRESRFLSVRLKLEVAKALLDTYERREDWESARTIAAERLDILSNHSRQDSEQYIESVLHLAEILSHLGDPMQAHGYAKKCVQAYQEKGLEDRPGFEKSHSLMLATRQHELPPNNETNQDFTSTHILNPYLHPQDHMVLAISPPSQEQNRDSSLTTNISMSHQTASSSSDKPHLDDISVHTIDEQSNTHAATGGIPQSFVPATPQPEISETPYNVSVPNVSPLELISRSWLLTDDVASRTTAEEAQAVDEALESRYITPRRNQINISKQSPGGSELVSQCSAFDTPTTSAISLNLPGTSSIPQPQVTVLVIGESCCGKTSLIRRYLWEVHNSQQPYDPTLVVPYCSSIKDVEVSSTTHEKVEVVIWDTPGLDTIHVWKHDMLKIQDVHSILLCCSADDPDEIANMEDFWVGQIRKFLPDPPMILVSLKSDIKWHLSASSTARRGEHGHLPVDSYEELGDMGLRMRNRIGAAEYCECSAKLGDGVDEVFRVAAFKGLQYWKCSSPRRRTSRRFRAVKESLQLAAGFKSLLSLSNSGDKQ